MPGTPLGSHSTRISFDTTKLITDTDKLAALVRNPQTQRIIKSKMATLERNLRAELATELETLGAKEEVTLKKNTDRAFQETPSYIWESLRGFPGRKTYPEGTLGTFSTKNTSIAGGFWEEHTQKYAEGDHFVHDRLAHRVVTRKGAVDLYVGFAELSARLEKILDWIFYGTVKMQPRPLLHIAHRRLLKSKTLPAALRRAITRAGRSL